jgi:uncharacterized protein (TIGR00251 family)
MSDGFEFEVYVRPGSRRPSIGGTHDDVLVVATAARPIDGQANDAVQRSIAEAFAVRASAVSIIRGTTARRKRIRIVAEHDDLTDLATRLNELRVDQPQ